jgi:ubiquinone/menaquinone biosynthesis C-methylase UbiE
MNYDLLAADYAASRRVHPGIMAQLVQAVRSLAAQDVLEVGCGTGNYAAALQSETGANVIGVEASQAMLAFAAAAGVPGCQAVAEAIPFYRQAFDFIYTVDVVHHMSDVPRYLGEAHRVLRPGGLICTATDSERIIATRRPLAVYWPETVTGELERYHPIARLIAWMDAAGFGDMYEEQVEFAYLLSDAEPYRRRAYSTLQRISDEAWQAGLARLEAALARGPIECVARYTLVWGRRP